MRAALLIALKDLRQRLRDRSFFIFGLLAPLSIAFVFNLLIGPLTQGTPNVPVIGYVDADASAASAGMRAVLGAAQDAGLITWRSLSDEDEARQAVRAGDVGAAVVVPAGLSGALGRSEVTALVVTSNRADYAARLAETLTDSYLARVRATSWAVAAVGEKGGVALSPLIAAQLATAPQPVQLVQRPTSARQLDMVTYYAAGMAVFFVFFIVQMGVAGLLDEEKDGTMTRLLVAPIERRSIIGGKVSGSIVIGVLSLLVLWGASTAIMGAKWGQPVGVLLLIVSVVAAAAGVLMAVAGVARSAEAAGNMQAIVAVVLGALGGVFVPLPEGGGVLSYLSRLSPHYWFLRGLGDLAGTGSPAGVLIDVAAILAFAALAGGIGWALMGRRLDR